MIFIKTSPYASNVYSWPTSQGLLRYFNAVGQEETYSNFVDDFHRYSVQSDLLQNAFLHVVTETVFDYPTVVISEKTIKPIANKRPFVILNSTGSLQNLRNMGFKTFDSYWDESYDSDTDPEVRFYKITKIVSDICLYSTAELQDLCRDMADILEHNFNFYYNGFRDLEMKKFEELCMINLGIR